MKLHDKMRELTNSKHKIIIKWTETGLSTPTYFKIYCPAKKEIVRIGIMWPFICPCGEDVSGVKRVYE